MAVVLYVFHHASADCFAGCLNGVIRRTHRLGGKVGVCTSTIPVTFLWLGVERHDDVEIFGDAMQEPARDIHLVTDSECVKWANLIFPLSGHHLGVGARDHETSFETCDGVNLDQVTPHDASSTNAAVVRPLGARLAIEFGETVRATVQAHQCVFLLDAVDHAVLFVHRCCLGAGCSRVGWMWLVGAGQIHLAHHQNVATSTKWVFAPVHRFENAVR